MRPFYDDFDDLDGDFADSVITRHLLQKKLRDERQHARRHGLFANKKRKQQFDDDDDFDDEYDEYDEYDEDYDGDDNDDWNTDRSYE